jgi:hypothetical protein
VSIVHICKASRPNFSAMPDVLRYDDDLIETDLPPAQKVDDGSIAPLLAFILQDVKPRVPRR